MGACGFAHEPLTLERAARSAPEQIEEARRTLDIGEEQRHGSCGQPALWIVRGVHAPSLGARTLGVHCRAVFDTLSDKLQATLGGLGRSGHLDEEAISKAMREIRLACSRGRELRGRPRLHASVKERALGQDVLRA